MCLRETVILEQTNKQTKKTTTKPKTKIKQNPTHAKPIENFKYLRPVYLYPIVNQAWWWHMLPVGSPKPDMSQVKGQSVSMGRMGSLDLGQPS